LGEVTSNLLAHCEEYGFPHWLALGKIGRGWFWARTGRVDDGLALLQTGIEEFRSLWGGFLVPAWLVCLADVFHIQGRLTEAGAALDDSLSMIERFNERIWQAENHRIRGEVALSAGKSSEAATAFGLAVHVAREQSARCLELRAVTGLARLRRDQGNIAEARELLTGVYNWFSEGVDTPVLEEARRLIASMNEDMATGANASKFN
jgi:predicted ATPase